MTETIAAPKEGGISSLLRVASVARDRPDAIPALADAIGTEALDLVLLMVSPGADLSALIAKAALAFGGARVVGCTTAGEIDATGYAEGRILATGFPRSHFVSQSLLVPDLDAYDRQAIIDRMIRARDELAAAEPDWDDEFNFLAIDGLSTREDRFAADIALGLGAVPLFGGSAGDNVAFGETFVFHEGRAHGNAAILTQFRTRCPVKVFKTDHLVPTDRRMVVTGADPEARVVHEINAEPAAREYARILGFDPEQLDTFTFAAHPVVVKIGGQHHVRAIQRVADNGDLVFFSAIDEGLVLNLAEPRDMAEHLAREMARLAENGPPDVVLACDCILRRIEAERTQSVGALSQILSDNRVVGFSTYGEQFNSMHVNQTLTGVAIYPPREG